MKKGFTLLEVMLALAVFALAMSAIVGFNARGYLNDARARKMTVAVELARGKMVEYQLDLEKDIAKGSFPEEKSEEGAFEKPYEDYRWKVEIRKVELPLPPMGEEGGANQGIMQNVTQMMTKQISEAVRELKLTISWKELEKDRSFSVVTHIAKM